MHCWKTKTYCAMHWIGFKIKFILENSQLLPVDQPSETHNTIRHKAHKIRYSVVYFPRFTSYCVFSWFRFDQSIIFTHNSKSVHYIHSIFYFWQLNEPHWQSVSPVAKWWAWSRTLTNSPSPSYIVWYAVNFCLFLFHSFMVIKINNCPVFIIYFLLFICFSYFLFPHRVKSQRDVIRCL